MSLQHSLLLALRSMAAMGLAMAIVFLVNTAGGWLAAALGFPGGSTRLAWDLGCVFVAGLLATRVLVRLAPCAPRRHALALLLLMLAVSVAAVIRLGAEFPVWFSTGLLFCVPVQVAVGVRWALHGEHVKPRELRVETERTPPAS